MACEGVVEAAALRLPCFPVEDSKKPCIKDWQGRAARTPKQVRRLWRAVPGPLIGVLTGKASGIDALDIDPRNGGAGWLEENQSRLLEGRRHETRSGGTHILFRHGESVRSTVLASGVDVLADGRFVVWWPAAGFPVVGTMQEIPEWPAWLLGMMQRTPHTRSPVSAARMRRAVHPKPFDPHEKIGDVTRPESRSAYVRVATKRLFWLVANAAEGTRATKLNMAAFRLGQLGVPFDKAEGMLTRAAIRCGLDTDDGTDIQAVIRCGFEAGSRNRSVGA